VIAYATKKWMLPQRIPASRFAGNPKRDPLLRIRQVIYSTKGRSIMYVLGFYRSDRHNSRDPAFR